MSDNPFPVDMQGPPKGLLEKLGAALPVALTAIATAFAGLSTSEMSRAMYYRSAAAQDQAKANDQWSLAAHKRDRAIMMQTTATQLWLDAHHAAPNFSQDEFFHEGGHRMRQPALRWLQDGGPPNVKLSEVTNPAIRQVLDAIRTGKPDAEILTLARYIDTAMLDKELDAANAEIKAVDAEWQPILDALAERLEKSSKAANRSDNALHLSVEQRRYRIEASLNQQLGHLYEVRVRTSTVQAERHRVRSDYFFYALLVAQAGAALGAMALARRHRSVLWLMAGVVGLVAVGFGAYVYLNM